MQVLGGKKHPAPLLEPAVDFIFERTIDQDAGERVIDTNIDFVPPTLTRLNGRKYIGENTVRDMGRLIGLVDGGEARRIQAEFDAFRAQVAGALSQLGGLAKNVEHVLTYASSASPDPVPTPPADQETQIELALAQAEAEASQTAAHEAAKPSETEDEDVATKHLTGAERAAVERHTGPLREVGDRGDLVDVPEEFEKAVDGVEEVAGTEVAKATFSRGLGHAEQAADEQAAADEVSQSSPVGADDSEDKDETESA